MIFIKIPSTVHTGNDGYTNVLHELGIESEPNTYMYLNITEFSVGPYTDEDGNVDESKAVLINKEGQAIVTVNKRPVDLVNMLGQCIMEVL